MIEGVGNRALLYLRTIMKIWVWLALLAIVAVPVQGACAETEAFDKGWLKLLHYEKNGSGYESVVENGEFF